MNQSILIVEDDGQESAFLQRFFEKHGYRARTAATVAGLFSALDQAPSDLVVLDLILPDEDGLEAARRLRRNSEMPIIMLSARDEVTDRIVGLELGADDYVTKPYEPRELLARVRSVMRRHALAKSAGDAAGPAEAERLHLGEIDLDLVRCVALRHEDGQDLGLTSTEFTLLKALTESAGSPLSREALLDEVYGGFVDITDRAIDAHVVRVRRKLAQAGVSEGLIRTVHGVGYELATAVTQLPS